MDNIKADAGDRAVVDISATGGKGITDISSLQGLVSCLKKLSDDTMAHININADVLVDGKLVNVNISIG